MTERRINLDVRDLESQTRIEWLMANGIDPLEVPAIQEVLVTDTDIVFIEFLPKVDSLRPMFPNGRGYRKQATTVPLISAPENFGL